MSPESTAAILVTGATGFVMASVVRHLAERGHDVVAADLKAPDALLKIGYCQTKLGDAQDAKASLAQVVEMYPRTDAAKLAEKRLKEDL